MPSCRLPDGSVIGVGSCQECDLSFNGACMDDPVFGPGGLVLKACFVRNVLLRSHADALLDIGSADSVSARAISYLAIGDKRTKEPPTAEVQRLTPKLRRDLARQITGGMLQLATTYRTTVNFRDIVLMSTPRGRQLREHYERNLGEMYQVATQNLQLVQQASTTWLAVHPYVAAMVKLTQEMAGPKDKNLTLSAEQFQACKALLASFRDASQDLTFKHVLANLDHELDTYRGLNAAAALVQLRAAPVRDDEPGEQP